MNKSHYIYLGGETAISTKNIIGVFDMDTSTVNKATRDFLNSKEKNGQIEYANFDLPKSFVITNDKVYISPLNTSTISKRIKG